MLAAGDLNGSGYLWDVAKDKVTGTFPDSSGEGILRVALSPDGTILAANTVNTPGYTKGSVVLWNTSSGKLIATLSGPSTTVAVCRCVVGLLLRVMSAPSTDHHTG